MQISKKEQAGNENLPAAIFDKTVPFKRPVLVENQNTSVACSTPREAHTAVFVQIDMIDENSSALVDGLCVSQTVLDLLPGR
jgi:hypothetical protein